MNQAIQEIEHHLHNVEVWLEPKEVPVAGTNEAVVCGTRPTIACPAFDIDAGNETWGTWVCVLGSGDTPAAIGAYTGLTGYRYYDLHKIGIQTSERSVLTLIQFGFGTVAAGVLTGPYTTIWWNPTAATGKSESILFMAPHTSVGTQTWARALIPNADTGHVYFNYGMHFYIN